MKFFSALVLVISLSFSSLAFTAKVEEVRVFQQSTTDAVWPDFLANLDEFLVEQDNKKVLPTDVLGHVAYQYAVDNGYVNLVSESYRNLKTYIKVFKVYNTLGEFIELDEVRRRGQAEGFFLPIEHDWLEKQSSTATDPELQSSVATGAPVVAVEGEKSSAATTPAQTTKPEGLQTQALEMLNNQFDRSKKEVERLQGELVVLKRRAGAVTTNTNKIEALEAVNSEILKRLDALKGSQNETLVNQNTLAKLLRSLGGVIDEQRQGTLNLKREMEARMKKVEDSVSEQDRKISSLWKTVKGYHTVWLGVLSLAVVLLCVVVATAFFYGRRRVDALDFRVEEVATAVDNSFANEDLVKFVDPQDRERIKTAALKKLKPGDKLELPVQVKKGNGNEFVPFKLVVEYNNKESLLVNIPRNRDAIYGSMTTVDKKTDLLQMMRNAVKDKRLPPPLRVAL